MPGKLKTRIYPERHDFTLRLSRTLREQLGQATEAMPLNDFIATTVQLALAGALDPDRLALFEDRDDRGPRMHVSVRMVPSLFARVERAAAAHNVSKNKWMAFIIHEALHA